MKKNCPGGMFLAVVDRLAARKKETSNGLEMYLAYTWK
jgi:hypothetical protein